MILSHTEASALNLMIHSAWHIGATIDVTIPNPQDDEEMIHIQHNESGRIIVLKCCGPVDISGQESYANITEFAEGYGVP